MPNPPRSVALLVTTYNRPDALDLVLHAALRQQVLPEEILVADDGSGDETARVVAAHERGAPVPVRHIWHPDQGFRLSAIRNRAIEAATADYIVMIDGDIVLHPGAIAAHRRCARPDAYIQGSRAMLGEEACRRALAERRVVHSPWSRDLSNRLNALYAPVLRWLVPSRQDPLRGTRGCHMAFWRAHVERINGFNEEFEGWGREDSEFAARMIASGVRRLNLKFAAVAYHLHHPTREQAVDTSRNHRLFEATWQSRRVWCRRGLRNGDGDRTPWHDAAADLVGQTPAHHDRRPSAAEA